MTQGELEQIPKEVEKSMNQLQIRIMEDIVRRIRINGFSTATADWQYSRLIQLGMSEKEIKAWIAEALGECSEAVDRIYSDDLYKEYMGEERAYEAYGLQQIPFEDNQELQQLIAGVKEQTMGELERITGSMGFVKQGVTGKLEPITLSEYYTKTLDNAMYDIHSGAFDYNTVLERTINDMTRSGMRWIDYESGWHNRVPVAARRAVMTGFRQVQGKINEQTAKDLGTDSYEVTVHIGARPTHQPWEGKVWTMEQLRTVCGLGEVTGLHGANCYHDYNAFIPGVSVRTYTDEELDRIHEQENTPKTYLGKEYTTYEALQRQRLLETRMRKYREDVHLLEEGKRGIEGEQADLIDEEITLKKARFQGTMQEYVAFSDKMDLPLQKERIYQDGLKVSILEKEPRSDKNPDAIVSQKEISPSESDIADGARRLSKSLRERKKIIGFDGLDAKLKISFRRGLKTASPVVRDLLDREAKEADYMIGSNSHSYYSSSSSKKLRDVVILGKKADATTMAHELLHRIDERHHISSFLYTSLQNDYNNLLSASSGDIKSYLIAKYPNAFEQSMITGKLNLKIKYRGISDILNGLSKGQEHYGYGHPKKYWQTPGAVEKESVAQFGRIHFDNNKDVIKMFTDLFPTLEKNVILGLKGVR